MDCIQLSLFGRTYPEPFPATTEKTSGRFWKNLPALDNQTLPFLDLRGGADGARPVQSPETDGLWLGDSWTVNISEWPSAESVSLLSSTLEVNAPEKYYLSARACQGILTRASRRGKKLPDLLQTALLEMIEWWEPGASARVMEALAAEEQKRIRQEKLAALNERKEHLEEIAVKQLRIRLKSALGAPEAESALVQTEKVSTLSTLQDQTLFQLIREPTYCISGNTVDRKTNQNGSGVRENGSFTVNTVDRHAVVYSIQEENPAQPVVLESNQVHATVTQTGICPTLPASMGLGGGYVPMITDHPADKPVVFENHAQDARYKEAPTCSPTGYDSWGTGGGNTPLVAVPGQVTSYGIGNGQAHAYASKEKSGTLDTMHDAQAVAIEYSGCLNPWDTQGDTQARRVYGEDGTFPALPSRESAGGNQQAVLAGQRTRWIVRRLTPTECERLQGYPDGWTDIGEWTDTKGKKHKAADSPRYKALGNSIALPQWFWIAQKMKSYMGDGAKLGSLFDGIGGFPLVWETTYGIGTARWASEIEEFPIAVTKKHFPERKEYEN